MKASSWLSFSLITMVLWGVWGAFIGLPNEKGFPDTLSYIVWSITMIPPALLVMYRAGWKIKHDLRSLVMGCVIGLLGAGGQMLLFHAVKVGPTYLIFPVISLSPVITIVLSIFILKERVGKFGIGGIILAITSLPMFDLSFGGGVGNVGSWFPLAVLVLLAWGMQSYFMKLANATMNVESIFFYMMVMGLAFIPVAWYATDFSSPINLGFEGPGLAAIIQVLNAVGALALVYAFRYGKAIVIAPLVNAGAPLITSIIAMLMAGTMPSVTKLLAIALAIAAALLLALQPDESVSIPVVQEETDIRENLDLTE